MFVRQRKKELHFRQRNGMEPWVCTSGLPRAQGSRSALERSLGGFQLSQCKQSSYRSHSSSLSLEYRCAHVLAILDCYKNQMVSTFLQSSSCIHPTHLQKYSICSSGENPSVFKGLHRCTEIQNPTAVFEQGYVSKWSVEPFFKPFHPVPGQLCLPGNSDVGERGMMLW